MSGLWPQTAPSQVAATHAALRQVGSIVAVASGLAASGRVIDLDGLQTAAGRLCALVMDLPPRDGAALRDGLIDLERAVDGLRQTLRRHER